MMGGVYPARLSSLLSASGVLAAVWWCGGGPWWVVVAGRWVEALGPRWAEIKPISDIRYKRQAK